MTDRRVGTPEGNFEHDDVEREAPRLVTETPFSEHTICRTCHDFTKRMASVRFAASYDICDMNIDRLVGKFPSLVDVWRLTKCRENKI